MRCIFFAGNISGDCIMTLNMKSMTELAGGELCLPQRPHSQVGVTRRRSKANELPWMETSAAAARSITSWCTSLVLSFVDRNGHWFSLSRSGTQHRIVKYIYTTIAALSPKSFLKIWRKSSRALPILTAIIASIFMRLQYYMLPLRDLCATAFCVCPLFFYDKKSS